MNMISILGKNVREHGDMVSLTDLWKASGSDPDRAPAEWLRHADNIEFLLACAEKVGGNHVFPQRPEARRGSTGEIRRWALEVCSICSEMGILGRIQGRNGGTIAHWQIALAYAKHLSPELHIAVNDVYMRYKMGDVTLAEEIVEKTNAPVEDLARLEARTRVKITNKMINSRVFRAGGGPVTAKFVATTNAKALTGKTPRQLLESKGIKGKKSARDVLSTDEMIRMAFLESLEAERLEKEKIRGHREILDVVEDVAEDVAKLIRTHTRVAVNV